MIEQRTRQAASPDRSSAAGEPVSMPTRPRALRTARCRIRNVDRGTVLADQAEIARSFWARGIGLAGRRALPEGAGLIIDPCSSIQTWFMAFPIDVAFVARDGRVVRVAHAVPPWRLGPIAPGARYVVELPPGTLARTGTVVADRLTLEPAPGDAAASPA